VICVWVGPLLFFLSAPWVVRAEEFQSWSEVDIAGTWGRVDLLAPFVARTDAGLPNPQLAATGLMADFHVPAHLTLTAGYLFADLPQGPYHVQLPLTALTGTMRKGSLTVADRNRFEELIGYPGTPVRYRNRLLFDYGVRRTHVFLDDEVFFNLSAGDFNQNRLQAGGGAHLTPRLLVDFYYLQKNPATGAATQVVGATLRITVTREHAAMLPAHNP
jgi:hypothetical protein